MLFRNDTFSWCDRDHRLLHTDDATNRAWAIALDDRTALPVCVPWSDIRYLDAKAMSPFAPIEPSRAAKRVAARAMARIKPLLDLVPAMFDPKSRKRLIEERIEAAGGVPVTYYRDLRRFWQGGQTSAALLGTFHRCGKRGQHATAGRGRKPKEGETYQLTAADTAQMKDMVEGYYLKDVRRSAKATYQAMLEKYYTYRDGNGDVRILPAGQRPSIRQFRWFLTTHYSFEVQSRKRHGDKDFERDHAPKLGDVLADCLGVGHYYEIDATVADVFVVSSADRNHIIGKPTIFLIIDRYSQLIVGVYVGLETPSWTSARQAILSIAQDKRDLCSMYDVDYDPVDWPAHGVFPKTFLADQGELATNASNYVCDDLEIAVANLPSQTPQKKPLVEGAFKRIHQLIRDFTPGYEPPSDAARRMPKRYELDASLTLKEFVKVILLAIITLNRLEMKDRNLSLKEMTAGVPPSPIELWKHNVKERSGLLPRYDEAFVRHALLSRDRASITPEGILFQGCYYACGEAMSKGWFVAARNCRSRIEVAYDSRLVDSIRVNDPSNRHQWLEARLTSRSKLYTGLSFAEVKHFESLKAADVQAVEASRTDALHSMRKTALPVVSDANAEYKRQKDGRRRKTRRNDTKPMRQVELRAERQESAVLASTTEPMSPTALVSSLPLSDAGSGPIVTLATSTASQALQEARRRMLHG